MKEIKTTYDFDPQKNLKLKLERGVSFEEIIAAIEEGNLLEIIAHSAAKYKHQKIYVVQIENYIYCVPFVVQGNDRIFLKTIFPNQKLTKIYLKNH